MTTNANPTNTNTIDPIDPHGLVNAGVELATPPELAKLLGVSRSVLEPLLRHELAERVRFVRTPPGGGKWRYSVDDAKAAIAPLRPALEEARQRAAAQQAVDQADAAKRKGERRASNAVHLARGQKGRPATTTPGGAKPASASSPPTPSRRRAPAVAPSPRPMSGPEVFVRRKFSAG
jgi:hypothetical protein